MKEKKVISILLAILLVFSVMPIVSLATDGTETTNEIEVANFDELKNNISIEGAILKLTEDITITEKLSINNTITIDGDGHNILGQNDNSNVYIEVLGGTVTIQNANLSQFGGNIGTVGQWGLIKVPAEANSSTKLVASNLNMKDFNRAAIDVRAGNFEITNCTIDCENSYYKLATTQGNNVEALTKGILIGSGSTVSGTIKDTKIINSLSTYEEWASSGIEVYGGATVTISNCEISDTEKGISVNNTYTQCGDVNVTVENTTINAGSVALRTYNNEVPVTGAKATVNILSGEYNGKIRYSYKSEGETIILSGGTFNGEISDGVEIAENMILENTEDGTLVTEDVVSEYLESGSRVVRVNNIELKNLVAEYNKVTQDNYYEESWNTFKNSLATAEKVLTNVNATKAEIDSAYTELKNSYNGLQKIPQTNVETEIEISVDENMSNVLENNEKVQSYVEDGIDVETVVEVINITPTEEEKKLVEEVSQDLKIADYFDISLLIKDAANDSVIDRITDLAEKVTFKLTLNDELKNVPEGFEREYKVIRIHEGKAEILDTTLSEDGNYIEFSTDKFSIYAISYADKEVQQTEQTDTVENEEEKDIVQTGDYIYIAIGAILLVVVANVVYTIKKKHK